MYEVITSNTIFFNHVERDMTWMEDGYVNMLLGAVYFYFILKKSHVLWFFLKKILFKIKFFIFLNMSISKLIFKK
jgi:hypothetical protein